MTRFAVWLLAASAAVRLVVAGWLPLGTDEAYAIAVAREFSWSFFDHPPLAFWAPVLMVELTEIEHPFIYRLPFVVAGTVTGWALWRIAARLGGARAGDWTLILYMLAPYMMIGGGVFVVPDGPLNAFASLSALALVRVLQADAPRLRDWLPVGLWLALAMMCKYQAALFPVSVLAFLLLTSGQIRRLATPGPWIAAVIGLAGLAPVVIWNIEKDWISFGFHTDRVGLQFRPDTFARMTAAQFLYLLPPVCVIAALGLGSAFRRAAAPAERLLGWLALLPIAMFMGLYLFGSNAFPHWTMPGWVFALALGGLWLSRLHQLRWVRLSLWAFGLAVWALIAALILHVPSGLLTRAQDPLPAWDNTAEMFDYGEFERTLRTVRWLSGETVILATDWIEAGHLSTALQGRFDVRVIGPEPHHFQFMSAARVKEGLLLVPGRGRRHARQLEVAQEAATRMNLTLDPLGEILLPRAGRPYLTVTGFRVSR